MIIKLTIAIFLEPYLRSTENGAGLLFPCFGLAIYPISVGVGTSGIEVVLGPTEAGVLVGPVAVGVVAAVQGAVASHRVGAHRAGSTVEAETPGRRR